MSSFAGYCGECGKPVMHKTLFGTLHVCISPDQHEAIQAMRAQEQMIGQPSPLAGLIKKQPWLGEAAKTTNTKRGE